MNHSESLWIITNNCQKSPAPHPDWGPTSENRPLGAIRSHLTGRRWSKPRGKPQEIWRISGKTCGKCLEKHGEITKENLVKPGKIWRMNIWKIIVKQGKRKYWDENDGNIEEKRKEWGEEWGETGRNHQKTRERIGWNPRFRIGYQAWNGWNPLDQVVESPFFQDKVGR